MPYHNDHGVPTKLKHTCMLTKYAYYFRIFISQHYIFAYHTIMSRILWHHYNLAYHWSLQFVNRLQPLQCLLQGTPAER